MNPEDYPPLTVAVVTLRGDSRDTERLAIKRGGTSGHWFGVSINDPDTNSGMSGHVLAARPVLVLDPENPDSLRQMGLMVGLSPDRMKDHVQRVLDHKYPAKPTVYEHIVTHVNGFGLSVSLCGKTWQVGEDVEVEGRCPDCTAMIANWRA